MCPDGAVLGHLRTNAVGANLNREWCTGTMYREKTTSPTKDDDNTTTKQNVFVGRNGKEYVTEEYSAPTMERSPEVVGVLQAMERTQCDVFIDVHGDEALPFNFVAQPAVENFNERLQSLHGAFIASYQRSNSNIQALYGYPAMSKPSSVYNTACKQIAFRYNCLAVTLEMPFKDCYTNPNPIVGWNPIQSKALGASVIEPLLYVQPYLREESDFWNTNLRPDDAYVRPTIPSFPIE